MPQPVGKMKKVYEVEHRDMERYIEEMYGCKGYDIVAEQEWGNNEKHSIIVDGVVDKWDEDKLYGWQLGLRKHYPQLRILLNALARDGRLEHGEYLIDVSW